MSELTVLVLGDPSDKSLRLLREVKGVRFVVGEKPEDFDGVAAEGEAVFSSMFDPRRLGDLLAQAPRVRWMHIRWAGLDNTLTPAVAASSAVLTNSKGVYSSALGEFVLAAILYFAKDLRRMLRNQAASVWEPFEVDDIRGATLGIVGYGDIGREIAERAHAMGMRILALRRSAPEADPRVDEFVPPQRLDELMARSDYVAVALPLTAGTRAFVGRAAIDAMKPTAVFINVGRGPVVEEAALLSALQEKRIRGAALDVFETEPLVAGHPFYGMENVLVSPHTADRTRTWQDDAVRLFLDNLERFRAGKPLRNVIDKTRGY